MNVAGWRANYYFGLLTVAEWSGRYCRRRLAGRLVAAALTRGILFAFGFQRAVGDSGRTIFAFYGDPAWMFPALGIAEFFLFLNTGPLNAAIVSSVAAPIRATAIGLNLFIIHLLGDAISPTIIGAISDRSSLRLGFSVTLVAMVLSGGVLFLGTRYAPARAGD